MRERFPTRRRFPRRSLRAEDQLSPFHVSRVFDPGAIDIDDLAEAVGELLRSGYATNAEYGRDPDLLLKRRRVSHVMGAKGAPST
jgi:hypothetical protein